MSKIIIIDGNSLLFRGFFATYAINPDNIMRNSNGVPTNAIFAFSNMIASLMNNINKDDAIFVAFDKGKHTFRHQMYKDYKANRASTPEDLLIQMPIARDFLNCLNIKYLEDDNLEADDLAGIVAKQAEKEGYKVQIYTSDKDYLQLIDGNITVKLIKKGLKDVKDMDPISFKKEWGFDPIQIIDYKGLMGDPSDNLKGIPKIGDKTAKKLICEYGSLEEIIAHKDRLSKSLKETIENNAEQGKTCKSLATIQINYPYEVNINDFIYQGYDFNKINNFANEYQFKYLVSKLPAKLRIESEIHEKIEYEIVNDLPDKNYKKIGFSLDISNENYHSATLFGIAISDGASTFYIEKNNIQNAVNLLSVLSNENIEKFTYDYKLAKCVLNNYHLEIRGKYNDLLLSLYLIDPLIKNDFFNAMSYFGIDISKAYNNVDLLSQSNVELTTSIAYYSLVLDKKTKEKLAENEQLDLLNKIELPLADVLADIEIEGFPINKNSLLEFGKYYEEKLNVLKESIYGYAGKKFNINSTKELSTVLFDDLKLSDKFNKKHSTSVDVLNYLKLEHPIIEVILEYRKYSKLLSTYVNGIIPYISEDGKIHATFNQAITQTGRLSSSEPNLQNISVRDEEGKQIRKCFYYNDPNLKILSLDYSQIELRILASLSNCKALIEAFNNGQDIHSTTAKLIFNLDREPNSQERRKAKAVNFGIVYGISDWGLSEQIACSFGEARNIIDSFYKAFPEIKEFINKIVLEASEMGYSTTIFNRKRYIPEFKSSDYQLREFAKRAAMNAPIQGSAADLIKIAMINVHNRLKEGNYKSKLISQIHDELILKVYDDEKDEVYNLVEDEMENSLKLSVAFKVDGGYASTWFDAK